MTGSEIEAAIRHVAAGGIVAVVDDGRNPPDVDLVTAGSTLTEATLAEMRALTGGQLHVPVAPERLDALGLPLMIEAQANSGARSAAFTVTVDLLDQQPHPASLPGVVGTIRALSDPSRGAAAFGKPGHVAPLRGRSGGVLRRFGHTEAAIDLARLAELPPVAVLATLHTPEGHLARPAEARQLLEGHDIPSLSISEIVRYRRLNERVVIRGAEAALPTAAGTFRAIAFRDTTTNEDHVALVKGQVAGGSPPLVRVHSECLTGDAFGSLRCDCGDQLTAASRRIEAEGRGVVLYMRQEGRGIGLANKLHAYQLQDDGLDTVEANRHLGFAVDLRDYGVGAQILRDLGLRELRLLTNNPKKTEGFRAYGLHVVEQIPLTIEPGEHNQRYLETKRQRMGHGV